MAGAGQFDVSGDLAAWSFESNGGVRKQGAAADGKADNLVQQRVSFHLGFLGWSRAGWAGTTEQDNASYSLIYSALGGKIL